MSCGAGLAPKWAFSFVRARGGEGFAKSLAERCVAQFAWGSLSVPISHRYWSVRKNDPDRRQKSWCNICIASEISREPPASSQPKYLLQPSERRQQASLPRALSPFVGAFLGVAAEASASRVIMMQAWKGL
jgi:hypothetical protein